MSDPADGVADVIPSATPSEDEIRAWQALPRDEQLRRLRLVLTHPDCSTPSHSTVSDILAEARARADSDRG